MTEQEKPNVIQLVITGKRVEQFKSNRYYALRPWCMHFTKNVCNKIVLNFKEVK